MSAVTQNAWSGRSLALEFQNVLIGKLRFLVFLFCFPEKLQRQRAWKSIFTMDTLAKLNMQLL